MFRIILFLCFSAFLVAKPAVSSVTIEIFPEVATITFPEPTRLSNVYSETLKTTSKISPLDYPIANALFNKDKQHIADRKKQRVLEQLHRLKAESTEFRMSAILLIAQIERWDVAFREAVNLDYDVIRTQASKNPMLNGNYMFKFEPRPNHIHLEGLISNPHTVEHHASATVSDYLDDARLLSSGKRSIAWVIYPDGHTQQVGYDYWNNQYFLLPPGSSIYVGFDSNRKEIQLLEQEILTLITWRVGK